MSLLQDIAIECTANQASVARILRLCLRLAAGLKNDQLKTWATNELNGYPEGSILPSYRVFAVRSQGNFVASFGRQCVLEIPLHVLPESLQPHYGEARLNQPIMQYESLLRDMKPGGALGAPWPLMLAAKFGAEHLPDFNCIGAWQELSAPAMHGMIDTVKTRVLQMALEIKASDPTAGEVQSSSVPLSESVVNNIVNNTIIGSQIQNVSVGSRGVSQSGEAVVSGDAKSLEAYLHHLGVDVAGVAELNAAIDGDKSTGRKGIGPSVTKWLADFGTSATKAGGDMAGKAIVGQLKDAILAYLQ